VLRGIERTSATRSSLLDKLPAEWPPTYEFEHLIDVHNDVRELRPSESAKATINLNHPAICYDFFSHLAMPNNEDLQTSKLLVRPETRSRFTRTLGRSGVRRFQQPKRFYVPHT
jgi:hypothetical protein